MRYDDEAHVYPINTAPGTQAVLVEGNVVTCDVKYRPRRQLVCHIEDGSGLLTLRFFNFYTSQLKQLAARSEEHTYELQSLMRISYAVFCLTNKPTPTPH